MKKNRLTKSVLIGLLLSLVCGGCQARLLPTKKKIMYEQIDSTMRAEIGDSITSIMLGATRIVAERVINKNDTINTLSSYKLNKSERRLVKFLFATQESYKQSGIIFGMPSPSIRFTFLNKKNKCSAEFDFSKELLIIKNSDEVETSRYLTHGKQFLKLALMFFPNDDFLTYLLNHKQ